MRSYDTDHTFDALISAAQRVVDAFDADRKELEQVGDFSALIVLGNGQAIENLRRAIEEAQE